ncbi:TetR family transcriptional regulator [Mycobacterium sp.]|uniref:acyl-CoA-like ligand-binding transcription factor n=1 Tax=Mycobacterium sp. TaxID=1785 RepID=UPI002C9D7484|nr:TetR family transcriptional regulator [Mycobacterium sp.]HME50205.1 TetR family transcriptional regulator [Mycobacterium sp.]
MRDADHPLGLRERKKLKTRETIRREAFRLIDENGWANTTVEQIAEAAEVSPSTFFRYFPSKESVLMADDLDPVLMAAFERQPADLSPAVALRRAFEATIETISDDQWEFERTRQRLVFSIPELKAAQFDEYYRTIRMLTEALARRLGRDAGDFEVRVFAGALAGAMMAVIDEVPMSVERIYPALDFIDAGMPLT